MSLSFEDKGKCIAKLGKQLICIDNSNNKGLKVIEAKKLNEKFTQVPSISGRESIYISGASGSGKSTYAADYIRNYKKIYPDNNVYLLSKVKNDPAFETLEGITVIDPELFDDDETDFNSDQFSNCLILFDDIDQLNDKIRKKVTFLRDQLLETGRHNDVFVISTSHLITNYKQSRILLNEANSVTFFPASGWYHIKRYLEQYVGLSKDEIHKIKNTKSRWVTIFQQFPTVVMQEKKIYIP